MIGVIIVNYNGARWIGECLTALRRTAEVDYRTIVVDNGSTDQSVAIVTRNFPEVELVRAERNLGFCEGNNLGIARALASGCDQIALLNPDTRVEPEWLRELRDALEEDGERAIAGAVQMRYEDDEFNSWTKTAFPALLEELRTPGTARRWIEVDWVEGACLLITRKALEEIGWLDPIFFAFYEEIDLCRRARAHGYQVGLVARSRIHHHRGGSWEATPEMKRQRDRRCDRSQFIYVLTDPQRSRRANLLAGLRTVATKTKMAVSERSLGRLIDLAGIMIEIVGIGRSIERKWAADSRRINKMKGQMKGSKWIRSEGAR